MDSNYKPYDHVASARRIGDYLTESTGTYEECDSLPDRDKLTFSNGFYANCSAIFMDIRESSKLPDHYKRPRLARIYRAYLSELVAIFNGVAQTREVNIAGDAAWAVINTPNKTDIKDVIDLAASANSLMKVLNYKMTKAGYGHPIRAGIGISYGRALMIKAGYSGSGINDVVYMGDVVNQAAKLAAYASSEIENPSVYAFASEKYVPSVVISDTIYLNLKDEYKKFFSFDASRQCYTGSIIHTVMEEWYEENCK